MCGFDLLAGVPFADKLTPRCRSGPLLAEPEVSEPSVGAGTVCTVPLFRNAMEDAYVLFEDGIPVYAGKTVTRHGFRDRLGRHAFTIQHRLNLAPATIGFKAIRILVFSNFDVEAILIHALRKADKNALAWNDSGFGSNDPGHNREKQEPAGFDVQRPIDIGRSLGMAAGTYALLDLLIALKDGLPYVLRYQTDQLPGKKRPEHYRTGHADQRAAGAVMVNERDSLRAVLEKVLVALPSGWRVTVFPDRVILYAETEHYQYAREYITA